MMRGFNQRFRRDIGRFLSEIPLVQDQALQDVNVTKNLPQGVYGFDLVPAQLGDSTYALICLDKSASTDDGSPINAYWLPWKTKGIAIADLTDEADYFFTSQLGGCQIRIVPPVGGRVVKADSVRATRVLHIAGDCGGGFAKEGGSGSKGSEWRTKQVEEVLKDSPGALQRSRAFSSTKPIPEGYRDAIATEESGGVVAVVGFRKEFLVAAEKMRRWDFWAQYSVQDGKTFKVAKAWQLHTSLMIGT